MNIAASTAIAALQMNSVRLDASAAKIANAVSDGAVGADPLNALVDQLQIKSSFQANAKVLQASLDMDRATFQIWA